MQFNIFNIWFLILASFISRISAVRLFYQNQYVADIIRLNTPELSYHVTEGYYKLLETLDLDKTDANQYISSSIATQLEQSHIWFTLQAYDITPVVNYWYYLDQTQGLLRYKKVSVMALPPF
ncbi:unnamed protein product [Ambrosiozyma monospora]|uniref:Unnamed protein product n=1 Tax=Ambrosiozyma monospora TaxID=43982 RepID=A0ACB5U6T7_AMBMO|nr:unnamed protein product [Ambrosiozyma monospora]